jgi:hypothetical protein
MCPGDFVPPRGDRVALRGANRSLDHAEHTEDGQPDHPAGKRRVSIVAIPFLNWSCFLMGSIRARVEGEQIAEMHPWGYEPSMGLCIAWGSAIAWGVVQAISSLY